MSSQSPKKETILQSQPLTTLGSLSPFHALGSIASPSRGPVPSSRATVPKSPTRQLLSPKKIVETQRSSPSVPQSLGGRATFTLAAPSTAPTATAIVPSAAPPSTSGFTLPLPSSGVVAPSTFGTLPGTVPVSAAPSPSMAPSSVAPVASHVNPGAKMLAAPSLGVDVAGLKDVETIGAATQSAGIEYNASDIDQDIPTYNINEHPPDPTELYTLYQSGKLDQRDPRNMLILTKRKWRYTPLYKKNQLGALTMWYVSYDIDKKVLEMTFGQVGGKIRVESSEVETNQSGRTQHQQSIIAACKRYSDKYRKDYYRPPGEEVPYFNKPMLAAVLKHGQEKGNTRLSFPVMVQAKLDGARCLARMNGDQMLYRSRGNIKWGHFNDEFDEEVGVFISYIPYSCELDGEAYLHGLKFSQFSRVIKNERVKDPRLKELIYYIYDFNCSAPIPFEQRIKVLQEALKNYLANGYKATRFMVLDTQVANNMEEIFIWHRFYMKHGFEGTIIRKMANGATSGTKLSQALYKQGRSMNMLKLKDTHDQEGIIVAIDEGTGTEAGAAMVYISCKHKNVQGQYVTTNVRMRPAYSIEERREWFANPSLVIGKKATYEFQEISEYGVPRNPVMKVIRDYEGNIDSDE